MKQSEAVFQAVTNVCQPSDEGVYTPTKDQKANVTAILIAGFMAGTIDHKSGKLSEEQASKYVPGLINNWLRKDTRLNGGTKYEAKNPGSRAGSGDAQVKAMKLLLTTVSDESEKANIQSFIDRRLAEIKPSKSVTIDVNALPEELRAKYLKGRE